jgi:hypothetical protein
VGTVVAAQLWERRRARHQTLSTDERGSGDGDSGAPVPTTAVQWENSIA